MPTFTASIKHGRTKLTPVGVSRCSSSNDCQNSFALAIIVCIARSVRRLRPSPRAWAKVCQYVRCAIRPASMLASGLQQTERTFWRVFSSRLDVTSSSGIRSQTQAARAACRSPREMEMGLSASASRSCGSGRSRGPSAGQVLISVLLLPPRTWRSHANGSRNRALARANSRCCASPRAERASAAGAAGLAALVRAPARRRWNSSFSAPAPSEGRGAAPAGAVGPRLPAA
mmetsp:Transcript_38711/g.103796  ORF Transcript_38711/g.103796 Transcript_38711/m.103796 type:complete len:230 (+) Transcript_38711:372-1061(+)